jgi:ABC-type branched-subunit amino acid transport system ATPase component
MILELKNISLSFTGGKDSFKILNGLNLDVPKGKITALVGGNGSGKTTLFNVICGFQKGFQGDIIFNKEKINRLSSDQIARKGIGRLFQGKLLVQDLTLLENMLLASNDNSGEMPFTYLFRKKKINKKEKEKEQKAIDILNRLFGERNKYIEMLHHKGSAFSYGEQRLISLARLFMGNYSLLLLDEPTAGVNPVYIDTIKNIISQMIADGNTTVLLIEHNMPFIDGTAHHCAFIDDGIIRFRGTAEEVLGNQEVKNSYLGL